ncbi:hypothetical protein TWF718_002685 [Orbilia javanica]|uniref:Uncharacterized protein n=1 Tax=Orbilia javanica TaxID=47235 RepID=A0AAN8MUL9_9PEZI
MTVHFCPLRVNVDDDNIDTAPDVPIRWEAKAEGPRASTLGGLPNKAFASTIYAFCCIFKKTFGTQAISVTGGSEHNAPSAQHECLNGNESPLGVAWNGGLYRKDPNAQPCGDHLQLRK